MAKNTRNSGRPNRGTELFKFRAGECVDLGDGPRPLGELIREYLANSNPGRRDGTLTVSDYLRRAVVRDLQHSRRSGGGKAVQRAGKVLKTAKVAAECPDAPTPLETRATAVGTVEPACPTVEAVAGGFIARPAADPFGPGDETWTGGRQ